MYFKITKTKGTTFYNSGTVMYGGSQRFGFRNYITTGSKMEYKFISTLDRLVEKEKVLSCKKVHTLRNSDGVTMKNRHQRTIKHKRKGPKGRDYLVSN